MAGLAETIAQLRDKRPRAGKAGALAALEDFGSNPGALRAYCLAPPAKRPAPLVVVLHGCTQDAAGYDHGSGWSQLAHENGFALLFPEQQRSNNPNTCFNWFSQDDVRRGSGEALSIRQMVDAMCRRYSIDASRIYVTGLSAGGAMACAMLASYPDVFAGGAIIAGLPFGTAYGVPQALERMRGHGLPTAERLGQLVEAGSQHTGPWPTVSVWHGGADHTVVPANARAIVDQWRHVHGAHAEPDRSDEVSGSPHHVWRDRDGREVIEEYRIPGLGHGTPLATKGPSGYGVAGPHMLEAGISSTWHIAKNWGMLEERSQSAAHVPDAKPSPPPRRDQRSRPSIPATNVGAVIEQALRAAGLMR